MYFRQETAEYVRQNRSMFEPFIEDETPFHLYVQRLAQSGYYGEHVSLVAFSRKFHVNIAIHQKHQPVWYLQTERDVSSLTKTLHLLYHEWEHYSSIRNINGPHIGPANVCLKGFLDHENDINTSDFIDPRARISRQKCCACHSEGQNITATKEQSVDPFDGEVDPAEKIISKACGSFPNHNLDNSSSIIKHDNELEDFFKILNNSEDGSLIAKEADGSAYEIQSKPGACDAPHNHKSTANQRFSHRRKQELAKRRRKENRIRALQSKSAQKGVLENSRTPSTMDLTTIKLRNIFI
jgi:hypothetical protein